MTGDPSDGTADTPADGTTARIPDRSPGPRTAPAAGGVPREVLVARAYLSRVAEPTCVPLWDAVRRYGPVAVADRIRAGTAEADVISACTARAADIDPDVDLAAAQRHGIRLVVPESPDWPHFALACLEATGLRRLARWRAGDHSRAQGGELVPPLALWVRGPLDPTGLAVRAVGVVGSRAATGYGEQVAGELSYALADREVDVISGGAYGIDAAAHRGALAASGRTVIVTAGGVDRPYPPSSARLFDAAAAGGLILSESPPGAAPHRHRFLSRNRLIAAFSTGTVVVEAAARSGARNTAGHCTALGRPLMVVPGPVTSAASAGCHQLLRDETQRAILVTTWRDVLAVVGSVGEGQPADLSAPVSPAGRATDRLREGLDALDERERQVFDGLPAVRAVAVDRLAVLCGLPVLAVIRTLPGLEAAGLAEAQDGSYRVGQLVREAARESRHRAKAGALAAGTAR